MKIAVSACLLGQNVRYNGKNKRCDFLLDEVSKFATFIPFCPENLAFKTPREPISLFEFDNKIRVISNERKIDLTEKLDYFAKLELERLKKENIDAIILKSKSPSCGLGSTDIFSKDGSIKGKGDGIFAKLCKEEFRDVLIVEEKDLNEKWLNILRGKK